MLIVALTIYMAAALVGCAGQPLEVPPDPSKVSFEDAVNALTGLRCEGPFSVEITDPLALELVKRCLLDSEPVDKADGEYTGAGTITMRFGDIWEDEPNDLIYYGIGAETCPSFMEWEGKWRELPVEFLGMLSVVKSYSPESASYSIPADDREFLVSHGWTPFFLVNTIQVDLPGELIHKPGDFPETLYWAWNNEVSKALSLDLSPYWGTAVETRIYKTVEMLPEEVGPNRHQTRAVLVKSEEKIVGAWLDIGISSCLGYSLDGCSREEVTGLPFDDWVISFIDRSDPMEQELARLSPEEVIETYYSAINRKDYQTAHACESRITLVNYLSYHMDNRSLHSDGFGEETGRGLGNYISVQVTGITRQESFERPEAGYGDMRCYSVGVKQERIVVAGNEGGYFISMKEETPETGWRLYGIGTGP